MNIFKNPRSALLIAAVTILWGGNMLALRELVSYMGPLTILAILFICCIPFTLFFKRPPMVKSVILWGLTAGFLQYALQIKGLEIGIAVGVAAVLSQMQTLFTPIFLVIFLRIRFDLLLIPCLSIGLVGTYLVATTFTATNDDMFYSGLCLIGSAISWALANTITSARFAKLKESSIMPLVVYAGAYMSIPSTILAYTEEGFSLNQISNIPTADMFLVASLLLWTIIAYLGGYFAWNDLIHRNGGENITRYSLLTPIFVLMTAYVIYDEQISESQVLGMILIFMGLIASHNLRKIRQFIRDYGKESVTGRL